MKYLLNLDVVRTALFAAFVLASAFWTVFVLKG